MTYERDWKKIDDLLIAGMDGVEVAANLGIHYNTLYHWVEEDKKCAFSEYSRSKKTKGEGLIKAHQFAKALGLTDKGDNTLLIWLGKTRCKQKEYTETIATNDASLDALFSNMPDLMDIAKLQKDMAKLKLENDELKRQANPKRDGVQQEVQYMGGCGPVGEDLLQYTQIY